MKKNDRDKDAPRSGCRDVVKLLFLYGAAVALLAGGIFYGHRWLIDAGTAEVVAAVEEAAERGLPLDSDDLADGRDDMPDDENAGLVYEVAFDACRRMVQRAYMEDLGAVFLSPFNFDVNELIIRGDANSSKLPAPFKFKGDMKEPIGGRDAFEKLRQQYQQNWTKTIGLLHEASKLDGCRYPVFWRGARTSFKYLERGCAAAAMLAFDAVAEVEREAAAEAVARIGDCLALSRAFNKEPCVASAELARVAGFFALEAAERLVAKCDVPEELLARLQADFEKTAEAINARRALEGELVRILDIYDEILEEDAIDVSEEVQRLAEHLKSPHIETWHKGRLRRDKALAIREMVKLVTAAKNPTPELVSSVAESRLHEGKENISEIVLPRARRSVIDAEIQRASMRAAAACIAAIRFERQRGKWPEGLDELAPEYAAGVLTDPFTGKPLAYRRYPGSNSRAAGMAVFSLVGNIVCNNGRARTAMYAFRKRTGAWPETHEDLKDRKFADAAAWPLMGFVVVRGFGKVYKFQYRPNGLDHGSKMPYSIGVLSGLPSWRDWGGFRVWDYSGMKLLKTDGTLMVEWEWNVYQ